MKATARSPVRFVVLCALLPLLFALAPRALAQEAAELKGYAVIAQDTDGTLRAAVVRDPDTGGRALVIGDMQNGAFTLAARCDAAIPADWADGSLTVEAHRAESADSETWVTVRNRADDASPAVTLRRSAAGDWQVWKITFFAEYGEHWVAQFTDGLMKLYPGHYIEEEGYLYRKTDPAQTAFAAFDPVQMKREMLALYDNFMAGEPPMIPVGSSAYALPQPCGATLKNGTWAVYTGPGRQYAREADGKAAVSAADWVQVFGTDGDWVLIQYRVQDALLRFGYIENNALQNPAAVPALTLESVLLENTGNEFVTSNPLGLGGRLRFDDSGVSMTRLGTLGDFWMYVELTLPNGKPARMFAEVSPSHG